MEEMDWEFGVSRSKLLPVEWINNKVLLYSIYWRLYSIFWDKWKKYKKKCIYVCKRVTFLYSRN